MRSLLFGFCALMALGGAARADEHVLAGSAILETLRGATVSGDGWSQSFPDGGATTYDRGGQVSNGRWDVRGDQYCSLWPPSDVWACYAMTIDEAGRTVTWIAADGSRTTGELATERK